MKLEFDKELTAITLKYLDAAIKARGFAVNRDPLFALLFKEIDRTLARAIDRIARRFEPSLRRAFLTAVQSAKSQATVETIARAMESLDPAAAIRAATDGLEFRQMRETLAQIVEAAGVRTTQSLDKTLGPLNGRMLARFDIVNPHAVLYARIEVGALIRDIDLKTRQGINAVIANAIEFGGAPTDTAKQIVSMIGLTEYQVNVALNYQSKLLDAGDADVDGKTQAYVDKLLRQRTLTIARTETLDAANGGQQAAWLSAQDQGFLDKEVEQEWIVTRDEKLCPICAPMPDMEENQHVQVGDYFVTGDGQQVRKPPEPHPNCRCSIGLRL